MPDLTKLAKELRQNQTDAEKLIWYFLRNNRLGCKFRRQHKLGGRYIVDFICLEKNLIIELDGGQHNEEVDRERTGFLQQEGFHLLRFWNNDVLQKTKDVLETIFNAVQADIVSPSPGFATLSPQGRGE